MLQYLDETNTNLNTKKYIIFHKRAFLVNYGEIGGLWLLILSVRPWMHTYMRGRYDVCMAVVVCGSGSRCY